MRRRRILGLGALAITLVLTSIPIAQSQQPAQPPVREITKIAGEVYRFRNASHYSVFAVTPAGVIATDPINADAARWLKAEIANRFKQPVKYVVYSHDHADHISGGEVFADTAVVVAHENAKAAPVDFIPVSSYSFRDFPDAYMPDWIESLRRVEAMEFDVLAPGHGPLGTKANVTMFREYLTDLRTDVIRYRLVQANRRGN